jgi:hypothetical protein
LYLTEARRRRSSHRGHGGTESDAHLLAARLPSSLFIYNKEKRIGKKPDLFASFFSLPPLFPVALCLCERKEMKMLREN